MPSEGHPKLRVAGSIPAGRTTFRCVPAMKLLSRYRILLVVLSGLLALYALLGFLVVPYAVKTYGIPALSEPLAAGAEPARCGKCAYSNIWMKAVNIARKSRYRVGNKNAGARSERRR